MVVAIGQEMDPGLQLGSIEVKDGFVLADAVTKQTSTAKVFAAGDVTVGAKSVVDAMAQGREAAISVDRYLNDIPVEYDRDPLVLAMWTSRLTCPGRKPSPGYPQPDWPGRKSQLPGAGKGYHQRAGLDGSKALLVLWRAHGKFRTCWSCLPCEVECPEEALYVKIPYIMR